MRSRLILGVILGGSLVSMTFPSGASAYRRTRVDDLPDGTPLFWTRRNVSFRDEFTAIPEVPVLDAREALGRSLHTWSMAGGCTDMVLSHRGPARADRTNLTGGPPDMENRIVFRAEGWPPEVGPTTLALTTTVYRRSTGEILDADIDVNAVDRAWSTSGAAGRDDVENTLTHELGHALGFAHSEVPEATMFIDADLGETSKRDLAPDDLEALCTVYALPAPRLRGVSCAAHEGAEPSWVVGGLLCALVTRRLKARRRG